MIIIPPLRLKVVSAISDLFRSISPDNGYQMDLRTEDDGTKRVRRGVLHLGESDPKYIVTIIEPTTAVEAVKPPPANKVRSTEWDLLIQGWAKDDKDNEGCDLAYVLAADVSRALALELKRTQTGRPGAPDLFAMGGKVESMQIGTPVVRPSEHVTDYGVFFLILTLKIVEDMANPFG